MLARLHLVTDDGVLEAPGFGERAQRVLAAHGEAVALHLRGPGFSGVGLFRLAEELAFATDATGTEFLVNDRVDVALAAGADGVQLGRRSLPVAAARRVLGADAWIGYSAHSAEEAAEAEAAGADFVLLGTIYPSASHPGEGGAGVELVRETVARVRIPVLAIGGITPERVGEVLSAGAYGVAVLSGVWRAADPVAAAAEYLAALGGGS
ncbi:MAG TPA: thiamine phosphate synthase [Longimicrobiales bacterium]